MGGLAPWVAIKMFHFAGDTLYAAHATAAQGSAGARSIVAAPRKVSSLQSQARSLTSSGRGHSRPQEAAARPGQGGHHSSQPVEHLAATRFPGTGASVASSAPLTAGSVR